MRVSFTIMSKETPLFFFVIISKGQYDLLNSPKKQTFADVTFWQLDLKLGPQAYYRPQINQIAQVPL